MLTKPCDRLERFFRWVPVDIEVANSEVLRIIRKYYSAMAPIFCVALGRGVDEVDIMTWFSRNQSPGFCETGGEGTKHTKGSHYIAACVEDVRQVLEKGL